MKIRRILLNRDLFIDDADILKEIKDEHEDDQEYQRLIKDAPLVKYRSKARVRYGITQLKHITMKSIFFYAHQCALLHELKYSSRDQNSKNELRVI